MSQSSQPGWRSRWWAAAAVAVGFFASRLLYAGAGVRFDATSLDWFWQYLELSALRYRLGESLLHLHSQPPVMNLVLGLVLKLAPGRESAVLAAVYLFLGLGLALGLYLLMLELGVRRWLAAGLAGLFAVSPACVLYENWLFYSYPVAVGLVFAALFWARYMRTSRTRDAFGMFALSGLVALTWSLFHLVWLGGLFAAALLLRPRLRRKTLVAAVIPLLVVTGWYAKNLARFGQFSASTWGGMSFAKMTNGMLSPTERRELYQAGLITGVSLVPPFSDLQSYGQIAERVQRTGIPVLDEPAKPSGVPNYNHLAYIEISRRVGEDAWRILRAKPTAYLRGLAESWLIFFLPTDGYVFLARNRERIRGLVNFANAVLGRLSRQDDLGLRHTDPARYCRDGLLNCQLWVILAYFGLFGAGLAWVFGRGRRREPDAGSGLAFVWLTVGFGALAGNALEVGENSRFRLVLDPLVLSAFAVPVEVFLRRITRKTEVAQRPGRSDAGHHGRRGAGSRRA
uniref:Glycosyltransferase RgtA/B/C/D-like domain-containing protein n=1 Tax=candidate division WOR-3 bacterium TaxID=2052148 RepID=A0A7C4GFV7_UNCW3